MIDVTVESLLAALPAVLREDETIFALATATAQEIEKLCCNTDKPIIYAAIDNMTEDLLDALAKDFKVDWWRPNAPIAEKRKALKSNWYVHRHLGTKAAVERAIAAFLGQGVVEEWYEYGGEPYHFRITGGSNDAIQSGFRTFMDVLSRTKRGSAILDSLTALIRHEHKLRVGFAARIGKIRVAACEEPTEQYAYLSDENGVPFIVNGRVLIL